MESLHNLAGYPWIQERLENGSITLNGWFFDFDKGELSAFQPDSGNFDPIEISETQKKRISSKHSL